MNEEQFLQGFDAILKQNKINEAKKYILDELDNALTNNNTSLIITILNEIIGFYRDLSLFDDSFKFARSLEKLIEKVDNPQTKFISYVNIGNSYRASSHYLMAHDVFNKALGIYTTNELNLETEFAALYNNLALLNQEEKDYNSAIANLNNALEIIKDKDLIKCATSYVNIAECYIGLNDLANSKKYIFMAGEIFNNNLNDFHIMGYYRTLAKLYYLENKNDKALDYYLKALCKIDKFVGRGSLYNDVRAEYDNLLLKLNKTRIKGLDLALDYYKDNEDVIFNGLAKDTLKNITIGLFGLGSECYFADDYISEDHDFNPGFVVLVEKTVPDSEFEILKNNYLSLPREYNRFYVRYILPKHGVHRIDEYLFEYLGIEDNTKLTEQNKSLLSNGKLFYVGENSSFYKLRKEVIKKNKLEYLRNLSLKALEISQLVPYNLKRSKDRNELDTYSLLKNKLIDRLIEFYYIYHKEFLPHDKLQLKIMNKDSIIYKWIINIMNDNIDYEGINSGITAKLYSLHIIDNNGSIYIDDYRNDIIKFVKDDIYKEGLIPKIVEIEWDMFTSLNNIGGRAECQNNKSMFYLMRMSQYYAWNRELLESYYNDVLDAKSNNYNILAIKYGFMEETVDSEHFKKVKEGLPVLSEKRVKLREAIVGVQLEMLDDYAKNNDISNMRSVYTTTDNPLNASYETYLRGELSSYSENTMYLYAKYITELSRNNKNIVELTLFYTNLLKNNF